MTKAYSFAGTTMTVLVSGAETGGAYSVLHVIKPSGSSTPPHSHDREFELSYVLSGTLSAETEGQIETRRPGGLFVLPPGRPHRLFNASGETVREVLLCAPALFDGFVAAAGSPVEPCAEPRPMTTEDRQRLVEIAPRFGVKLLRSAEPVGSTAAPGPQTPEPLDTLDSRIEALARLGTAEQDLVLIRATLEPGRDLLPDGHVDQVSIILIEGSLEAQREGAGWTMVPPDEAMHVPPDVRCAVRNGGETPAQVLLVSTVRDAQRALRSAEA